ncbi:MAG: acyltransferase [Porticoccaceae bacterium]|nr:acyltransferase [Porticoccaceae bacterium]
MINPVSVELPEDSPMMCGPVLQGLGRSMLRFWGWTLEGRVPSDKKILLIAAPHTSNWDWVIGVAGLLALGIRLTYIAKHTLFKGPLGWVMKKTGGVPVDRESSERTVDEIVRQFNQSERLYYAIAPEGTRKQVERWKTGFLRVAYKAKVPVLMVSFDYRKKRILIGDCAELSGDIDRDLESVQRYYSQFSGKNQS